MTLFTLPKGFVGVFDTIQRNAVHSWLTIEPRPEIILFGDDPGVASAAREYGLRHVPDVERNAHGTPLIGPVMEMAQKIAVNDLVCYVNADIILPPHFAATARSLDDLEAGRPYMAVGRKTSLPITKLLQFDDPEWAASLAKLAAIEGQRVTWDSDYFVFRKGHLTGIPPFAVGRCYWTQWFMFDTRRRSADLVDISPSILAVEPRHDYSHASSTGHHARLSGVEFRLNRKIFKGCKYFTTLNATLVLRDGRLVSPQWWFRFAQLFVRAEYWVYFMLKGILYPYSLPLIVAARAILRLQRALAWVPISLRRTFRS